MSAQEIIEHIKALPPKDKGAVLEFVKSLDVEHPSPRFIDPKEVERTCDKMFDQYDDLFRKLAQH